MTLREITKKLADAGIESARFEALLLIESIEKVPRSRAIADPGADYVSAELIAAVEKRAGRYPLQYILGEWEFCGLTFEVDENCLIPRPDTELLVEAAVRAIPKVGGRLLDLCTGSGCVAAATLSMTDASATGVAVELMHGTAELARSNMARLGLAERCRVICADLRDDAVDDKFDVITANPPYISTDEMDTLEAEVSYEPRVALTDGGDGLSLYEDIIRIYKSRLKPGGVMLLEHGYAQAEAVCEIARRHGMACETLRDLAGNARVAVVRCR